MRGPASASSLLFWRSLWITMRPYLAFVSGAAALAGMAFVDRPSPARLALAFVPLFLSYGLGQALTDCFQTDTDRLSAPFRPLVQGILTRRQVLAVASSGLLASCVVVALLDVRALLPAALAVLGLLAYTPLKRRWWGGPPWNAAVVALLPLIGWLAAGGAALAIGGRGLGIGFAAAVLAVFFAYADFVVTGYFKDISADRATGYRTFPVVWGWRAAARCADLQGVAAAALTAAAVASAGRASAAAWIACAAGAALSWRAHAALHRLADERLAHVAVAGVLRGFVLYASAIVLSRQPGWLGALAAFYALFELALRRRPQQAQI